MFLDAKWKHESSKIQRETKMAEMLGFVTCSFCDVQLHKSLLNSCDSMQCCPYCGVVISEEQVFSSEQGSANHASSSIRGSTFIRNRYEYLENKAKLAENQMTVARKSLKEDVARYCEKLQLSKEVIDQIQDFLQKVFEDFREIQNKTRLVGACIYIVSRNNDLTLTMKQVAVATGCTVFELGSVSKMMDKKYGLHRAPVTIESLISTACSDLPFAKECEELAQRLCCRCSKSMVLVGSPLPQAVAYCVLASLAVNKGTTQREEVTKLCLKMSQVSEKTVLKFIRLLKNYMKTLLEAIPWVNMKYVKMSNIHYYVKDIAKYEQNCGGFPAKVTDPMWYHKRENEIQKRKVKIQNALERICERQRLSECEASTGVDTTKQTDNSILAESHGSTTSKTTVNVEGNVASEFNSSVALETTSDADIINIENIGTIESDGLIATDAELDEEDKIIEELLQLGCSAQQLQEGFYETLKVTSSAVDDKIEESEIDSYVRKPDEVDTLKRVVDMDGSFDSTKENVKKVRRVSAL